MTGPSPVDRGKPGSKIHAVSDRNGLPLTVVISAANVNDSTLLKDVLDSLRDPAAARASPPMAEQAVPARRRMPPR